MKKFIIVILMAAVLTGCGWLDRQTASVFGGATETCVEGVSYLQFTSGVTVKYNQDGKIATCK